MNELNQPIWQFLPEFSAYLFWDRNMATFDFKSDDAFIIKRIFEVGKLSDIIESMAYYGKKRVIEVLTQAENLQENAFYLSSTIFQISKEQYKCFTTIRFRPNF
jgi:hypothetical protein